MSSDIKELKKLREVICRKQVSKIKKKYHKAEKKLCKKTFNNEEDKNKDYLVKNSFIEFKRRYFGELYKKVDEIINSYILDIEPAMTEFISEKKRDRVFEVIILIRNILDRKSIRWALSEEYIKLRKECKCPSRISIFICTEHSNEALNIFNVLGEKKSDGVYKVNDVEIQLSFGYAFDGGTYNLSNNDISYCILEGEKVPILE